ncbi:MAG TPA: DNA polymerase III subunit gamma/tau [Candidatus Acidoferrales bacterium]|nr:DNA polymerase III subunit gamma/tau [Candidatus Acidoferrales bacterium]
MNYLVTARKWRPMRFDEVTAQEHVTVTMRNAIVRNRIAHAYLFSGPSGVGKTTTARIFAKAINCPNVKDGEPCNECDVCKEITEGRSLDVIEIDGASNRGIDEIRDLRESVRYSPSRLKYKIYIIDEVHMLTKEAFNALLKTLEEPPPYAIFVLATTEPHKVIPTILTRCQRFDFKRIEIEKIIGRLRFIAKEEKVSVDEESFVTIAKKGDGSMRDALSIFDQVAAFCGNDIKHEVVVSALSLVDTELFFSLTDLIKKNDSKGAVELAAQVISRGYDPVDFLEGLSEHLRNLLIASTAGKGDLIEASEDHRKRYLDAASKFDGLDLLRLLKVTSEALQQIKYVSQPRIKLELTLLQLVNMERSVKLSELLQQVEEIKKNLSRRDQIGNNVRSFSEPPAAVGGINYSRKQEPVAKNFVLREPRSIPVTGVRNHEPGIQRPDNHGAPSGTTVSFQEITARWEELLQVVRKERIGVWSQLINLKPIGIRSGWLMLGAPNEVVIGMTKPYRNYIQDTIQKNFGMRVAIDFTIVSNEQPVESDEDDPLIKYLKDEFGAEPVE